MYFFVDVFFDVFWIFVKERDMRMFRGGVFFGVLVVPVVGVFLVAAWKERRVRRCFAAGNPDVAALATHARFLRRHRSKIGLGLGFDRRHDREEEQS
jgi:hypothetical protein